MKNRWTRLFVTLFILLFAALPALALSEQSKPIASTPVDEGVPEATDFGDTGLAGAPESIGTAPEYLEEEALIGTSMGDAGAAFAKSSDPEDLNASEFTSGDYKYRLSGITAIITQYLGSAEAVSLPSTVEYNGLSYAVTRLDNYAFKGSGIRELTLPSSIVGLGNFTFRDCVNLTKVVINGTIVAPDDMLYYYPFINTGTESGGYSVVFGDGVTSVSSRLFSTGRTNPADDTYAHVTSVYLPDSVTSIDISAFATCHDLRTIRWSGELERIGNSAFQYCSRLETAELPGKVAKVEDGAFQCCASLETVVLPESCRVIGSGAFDECVSLTSVTINGDIQDIQYGARFANTGTMSGGYSVTFGPNVTAIPRNIFFTNADKTSTRYAHITSLTIGDRVQAIGNSAFQDCYDLTGVTWGSGLKTVGDYAFAYARGDQTLDLPSNLTAIGQHAFDGWSNLKTLVLPSKLNSLGERAFKDCVNLTSVTINGTIQGSQAATWPFQNTGTASGGYAVVFGDGVLSVPNHLFYTNSDILIREYANVTSVTFPNSLKGIGRYSFCNCYNLIVVNWGTGLKTIDEYAFANAISLNYLDLPSGLTDIGWNAFTHCENVKTIKLPASLNTLNGSVFSGCKALKRLFINSDIAYKSWLRQNFYDTGTSGTGYTVVFGEGVTTVLDELFYTDSSREAYEFANVTEVILPESLLEIGTGAFRNCYALNTIFIGKRLTSVKSRAFQDCESLTSVRYSGSKVMWKKIDISHEYNDALINAQIEFGMESASPTGIKLNEYFLLINPGSGFKLDATVKPGDADDEITWSSSNDSVATVKDGQVTSVSEGVATIVAASVNPKVRACCLVLVTRESSVLVSHLKSTAASVFPEKIKVGQKVFLDPRFASVKGSTIKSYSTSNRKVATVSSVGWVTAKGDGKATITAKARNGKTAKITFKVVDPTLPTKVTLDRKGTVKLKVGEKLQLNATLFPDTARSKLTWTSSKPSVATVSSKGIVKAKKTGTTIIKVTTRNGKTAKVKIKVVRIGKLP